MPPLNAMSITAAFSDSPRAFETIALDVPHAAQAGVTVLRVAFDFGVALDANAFSVLADDERARAARFLRHEDGVRFAATRTALREAIGESIGLPSARVCFRYDAAGRPSIVDGPAGFDFNVSHSGAYALIAIARARRVGVDIESKRATLDWRTLAEAVFAPQDWACVARLPEHAQLEAFFDVWTAKEALLKAIGIGITAGLDRFSVLGGTSRVPFVRSVESQTPAPLDVHAYEAYWCEAPPGYAACIAWSKANTTSPNR